MSQRRSRKKRPSMALRGTPLGKSTWNNSGAREHRISFVMSILQKVILFCHRKMKIFLLFAVATADLIGWNRRLNTLRSHDRNRPVRPDIVEDGRYLANVKSHLSRRKLRHKNRHHGGNHHKKTKSEFENYRFSMIFWRWRAEQSFWFNQLCATFTSSWCKRQVLTVSGRLIDELL